MPITTHKCALYGCNAQCIRKNKYCSQAHLVESREARKPPTPPTETETVRESGDSREISKAVADRVRTLDDLIRVCEIDTDTWEVERWVCNKWDTAMAPKTIGTSKHWARGSTVPIVTPIFQVKVWLRRKVFLITVREELAQVVERAKGRMSRFPHLPRRVTPTTGLLLELSIPDLHAGMLAWGKETGWANYDTKIAVDVFNRAMRTLLERTATYTFDRVLFVVGNDLLNADNTSGSTTKGTLQDVDARFQKTFGAIRNLIIDSIELLRTLAPVDVVMVPGNHDNLSVWHLGDSLECYFHTYADVKIDNTPRQRKYYLYGKVMLMLTHGNTGRHPDYPLVMATEQPEMFGLTEHREAHTGHIHLTRVNEFHGVKVRVLPSLCPPSAWSSEQQYVGNGRRAEAFVWHSDEGLVATALYTHPER